jgi:hypothetical protein
VLSCFSRASKAEEVGFEPTEPETGSPVFETGSTHDATPKLAKGSRRMYQKPSHLIPTASLKLSPELADVVAAWPTLPEAIRAGILAMVRASKPTA